MDHSVMLGRYWLGALLGGYLFSLWWYRRRAEQSGVQTSTRRYLQVAVAGVGIGLAFPALVYLALDHWDVPPGFLNAVLTTIHYGLVPFLILGAGLLALARLERSTLLAAVAGGELLATALGVAYFRIGSFGADGIGAYDRMFAALAPGAVLLAGGVLATLRARRIAV
jgi:hypothetical protein